MKTGDTVFQNKRYTRQNAKLIDISDDKLNGTVMFDNGIIRRNISLKDFYEGSLDVSINGLSIGDEKEQRSGTKATIVKIYDRNCDVKFEDGTIKTNVRLMSFRAGYLGVSKCYSLVRHKEKVGLVRFQKCGLNAKIIKYYDSSKRCDIKFENGIIRQNMSYSSFLSGTVSLPRTNVGKKKLQKCGEVATVIKEYGNDTVDIQFESGIIRCNVRYSGFRRGDIPKKDNHIFVGMRLKQNCGLYAEVIELLPNYKCSIKFETGVVKENVSRKAFKSGSVATKYSGRDLIGLKTEFNDIKGEVLGYNSVKDCVKVLFESGIFIEISRSDFLSNNYILEDTDWNTTSHGFKYKVYKKGIRYNVVFEDNSVVNLSLADLSKVGRVLPVGISYIKLNNYNVKGIVGNILSVYFDSIKERYVILVANKHMRRLVIL